MIEIEDRRRELVKDELLFVVRRKGKKSSWRQQRGIYTFGRQRLELVRQRDLLVISIAAYKG